MLRYFLIIIVVFIIGYNNDNKDSKNKYYYLFLGHTYNKKNILDKRLLKFKQELIFFDQILLGGDVALSAGKYNNLVFLDSFFHISSTHCHWAFGNHDLEQAGRDSICNYTKHQPFYATYINGITLVVMETNYYTQGPIFKINQQTDYVKMVCDTISKSSHLVILTHQLPWSDSISAKPNRGNAQLKNFDFYRQPNLKFYDALYPDLIKVKHKNIEVLIVSGDYGQKQSTFEFLSKDSIYFIGNGIISDDTYNSKFPKWQQNDSVLVFKHNPKLKSLTWQFINIGD